MTKIISYDSVAEYLEVCDKSGGGSSRTADASHDWDWSTGWEKAREMADAGWQEAIDKIGPLADDIYNVLDPENPLMGVQHDVAGYAVDIGRAVLGEPECMFVASPAVGRKVVKIVCCHDGNASVEADLLMRKGAGVVALIDYLETLQYRCEVWATQNTSGVGDDVITAVCVKRAEDPVLYDNIGFWCSHPAAFRRIWFAWAEVELGGRYGSARNWPNKMGEDLYFGCVDGETRGDFKDAASTMAWVQKQLVDGGFATKEEVCL